MSDSQWTLVDDYLNSMLMETDPALDAAVEASAAAGLPPIQVPSNQGKLLHLIAKASGARKILEIGTLGGYSTIWLAGALPKDGKLITLELEPRHAEVARANFARAGLEHLIELRLGPALKSLSELAAENRGPFDFIFIDADKPTYTEYFGWALKLSRAGTVIIADNVVRKGAVADPGSSDVNVQGIRRFLEAVKAEPRVSATAIQTVGSKGHDGFAMMVVG
jgi:predicted O-methyltransferase YrrM